MVCRLEELRDKNVINIKSGANLGCVDDVVIDTCSAEVISLVIYGRCRFFGLFGREDDVVVSWENISVIGDDAILVCFDCMPRNCQARKKKNFFSSLFK